MQTHRHYSSGLIQLCPLIVGKFRNSFAGPKGNCSGKSYAEFKTGSQALGREANETINILENFEI